MAKSDSTRKIINGFEPVAVADIEDAANITYEQADAMRALFRAIARLTDDPDVRKLCEHGALQAELQGNEIDVIRERAMKAGFNVEAA